jgi:hypothetical protein
MEESEGFLQQLTDALAKRKQWLEESQIPRLKEVFRSYQIQFESAMGTLIRKGLLRQDPYNYEQSITDITVPADTPLPEFESADETSYRLAAFQRQLNYVIADQDFSLGALKIARLKKLSALLSYINWLEFGENSSSPTTRAFARVFMKVRLGPDAMSAQILKDQETQIIKTFNEGRSIIADLVTWHRESWKADVRKVLLPRFALEPAEGMAKKEEILRTMRKEFAKDMEGRPWYPALAQEILVEEMEIDAASRKAKLLTSLVVPEPMPAEKEGGRDAKLMLLEAVRILSRPHEELITAVESLSESERVLQPREGGLGVALRRLFGRAPREKPDAHTYEIQYSEPAAGTPRTEKVNFPRFADEARKKATLLAAIAAGSGPGYKRLVKTGETALAAFLDKQLNELLLIHRRLASFNSLFQARAAEAGKQGIRGIKLELLAVRNAIVKANQRRHEYGERAETAKQKGEGAQVDTAGTSQA